MILIYMKYLVQHNARKCSLSSSYLHCYYGAVSTHSTTDTKERWNVLGPLRPTWFEILILSLPIYVALGELNSLSFRLPL